MRSQLWHWRRGVRMRGLIRESIRQACIFIVLMAVLWFVLSEVMGWQVLSYQALDFQGWCTYR